jgi:hypothetical protein
MSTLLDPRDYDGLIARIRSLEPDAPARWGRLTAPRMVAHLSDQIRQTLGEIEVPARRTPLSWPIVRTLMMFWLPWPRGRIKGSPEIFQTPPALWSDDLTALETLMARFVTDPGRDRWPGHPYFGPMTREEWGRFSWRHFDHHLRQFGV